MKNEYFKVWTTPFTISCLIGHDYIIMLICIGLWISGIVFFFKSISAHLTVIEKYQTTPEDYFRAILILDFPDQGKSLNFKLWSSPLETGSAACTIVPTVAMIWFDTSSNSKKERLMNYWWEFLLQDYQCIKSMKHM